MHSVTDLIPQRSPILMIDEFLGFEGESSKTRLAVRDTNIFVDGGIMSECGLIEHIAQSAAARVGHVFRSKNEPVPLGYIGAVNNFSLVERPRTGDEVITRIDVIQEVMNISLIEAQCSVNDRVIARCKMKIFLDV